jgi:hypothetical protein
VRDGYAFRQHVEAARKGRGMPMVPEYDEIPVFYFTNHNAIVGPGDVRVLPLHLDRLDFELEAAIVVGKRGRNLKAERADEHVFGLTIMNDLSARALQTVEMKLSLGPAKGKDFATSLGPWLVTPDELPGFATAVIPDVELLVGQNRTVPFTLKVATVSETLTVTGESPLVDTRSSQVAGNVDRRQMEELPLQGRNWMELAMIVKGITANAVTDQPGVRDRQFQLNLDGQEITQQVAGSGFGQPRFSREAIAEFQVVTNMFDITQGRSTGVQVQAISRSGTNNLTGAVYGFFRSDRFNDADLIARRVLPYSNQQTGGAVGGPIKKDKLHYFFSYEREREPVSVG